jgi:hypothetical protein
MTDFFFKPKIQYETFLHLVDDSLKSITQIFK